MGRFPLSSRGGIAIALASGAALGCAPSALADVRIAFTGMNLVYDGASLYDAGGIVGGIANPAEADPLATVDFFDSNTLVGSLTSDVSLDFRIDGIANIPAAPNTTYTTAATPNSGFFDLLLGTAPLAAGGLLVDIQSVSVTYTDIAGIVEFVFAGGIGSSPAQNLPFGLQVADPITISISAQVLAPSITSDGGFITGFQAFGTGEYRAAAIPAPATAAVLGLGVLATRRRRTR